MNNIIANIRTQLQKLKCRIANLSNRVTYIEDNCCNGGGDGIQSIQEGDNISIDNTDPQNPIISATGTSETPTLSEVLAEENTSSIPIIINNPSENRSIITTGSALVFEDTSAPGHYASLTKGDDASLILSIAHGMSGTAQKGLVGSFYYGANYDDNTYVQKKYVDDNFLPLPTEGTTGQVLTTDGDGVYTWEDVGGGSALDQDNIPKLIEVSLTTLGLSPLNSDEEINEALVDYIESLNLTIGEKEIYDFKVTGFPEYTPTSSGGSAGKIQLNKSWGAIGHSIWASDGSLRGIQTIVKEHFEFTAYSKHAYNGASLGGLDASDSNSILSSTRTSIWTSKDIFTYDSITNDFKRNIPIGNQSDFLGNTGIETYYGALRALHETLKTLNPSYIMICANALKRDNATYTSWSANTEGHTLTDYSEVLEWVANRLSWRFINQFRDSGINDDNLSTFTSDGLHPNNDGYQRYAGLWINEFKKIS